MINEINSKIEIFLKNTETIMLERDEVMRLIILVVFSKLNIFFYGPPGTGKSLIDRVVQIAFSELTHFRCLMREGMKYEEIFGEEVKVDNSVSQRVIEGKLPTAELAFIDETWKGSDDSLNSLLSILNEKIFDDGYKTINVPLYTAVGASNEFPKSEFLNAIFERFPVRIEVPNIKKRESFELLVNNDLTEIKEENIPTFSKDEIFEVQAMQKNVKNSDEFIQLFWDVNTMLITILNTSEDFDGTAYQISGRVINMFGLLTRVSATLNKRSVTNISDFFLGKYVFWKNLKERKVVYSVIDKVVFKDKDNTLEEIDNLFEEIEKELSNFSSNFLTRVDYRVSMGNEQEYIEVVNSVEVMLSVFIELENILNNWKVFFYRSEEIYQEIDSNVLLYAKNVVSWRALEERIIIKRLNEFHDVIQEEKGLRYIEVIEQKIRELNQYRVVINSFINQCSDYFDYKNQMAMIEDERNKTVQKSYMGNSQEVGVVEEINDVQEQKKRMWDDWKNW